MLLLLYIVDVVYPVHQYMSMVIDTDSAVTMSYVICIKETMRTMLGRLSEAEQIENLAI